jgi:hypothetical protein
LAIDLRFGASLLRTTGFALAGLAFSDFVISLSNS